MYQLTLLLRSSQRHRRSCYYQNSQFYDKLLHHISYTIFILQFLVIIHQWILIFCKTTLYGSRVYVHRCKNSCQIKVFDNSNCFEVKVGVHQGSALSPLLFVIVMEAISRVALPWELLYADDLAVIAETKYELMKRLNEWKNNVEKRHDGKSIGAKQKL